MRDRAAKAAYDRAYLAANRERINLRSRATNSAYRTRNKARLSARRAAHPNPWAKAAHAVVISRLRARKYGVPDGSLTRYDFARLHLLPCAYCGAMPAMGADHVIPLVAGGPNALRNLVPACVTCNRAKGSKVPGSSVDPRHIRNQYGPIAHLARPA